MLPRSEINDITIIIFIMCALCKYIYKCATVCAEIYCRWEDAANNNNKNCDNFLLKKN